MSAKNCPLYRGFFIRILYETSPYLKKCPLERMSAMEKFHCIQLLLPFQFAENHSFFPIIVISIYKNEAGCQYVDIRLSTILM